MGGLFQLIAWGGQDYFLTENPQISFYKTKYAQTFKPLSLQNLCIKALSERQKTWLVNKRDSFCYIAEKILEEEIKKYDKLVRVLKKLSPWIQSYQNAMWNQFKYSYFHTDTIDKAQKRKRKYTLEQRNKFSKNLKNQQLSLQNSIKHDRLQRMQQFIEDDDDDEFNLDFFN